MKKKVLCTCIAVMMIAAAGCSSKTPVETSTAPAAAAPPPAANGAAPAPAANEAAASGEVEKPKKISFMVDGAFMVEEAGRQEVLDKYKELTGIELEINAPAHNQYYEKVNLVFATNDIPDVLYLKTDMTQKYGSNGVLHDIRPYYEKSEYLKAIDPKIIESMYVNGALYNVPRGYGNGTVTYARKDWLDKLGLAEPKNYDEFKNMLEQFKTLGSDVIPYTAPGIVYDEYPTYIYTREFFQNAIPDFIVEDGKWVDGMLSPEMPAALERFRDAFAAGLIDKEIITNNTSAARDKFSAGKVGAFNYWAGAWGQTLDDNLKVSVPEGSVVPLNIIDETTYYDRVPFGFAISSKAKNPEGIFKYFLEYMYDKGEGQMLFTHGVEGIHYEIKDGVLTKLASKANPTNPAGQVFMSPELYLNNFNDGFKLDPRVVKSREVLNAKVQIAPAPPSSAAYDKYYADVLILRKEILAGIVYGNITVEDGLKQYAEKSKTMVDAILAEFNK